MKPRKADRHLPACVYHKHGAYWYVKKGKWLRLADNLPDALQAYALQSSPTPGTGMADLIDKALAHMAKDLSENTLKQYRIAAKRLKHILVEFSPEQVKPKHVAAIKAELADTPNMANRILSFLRSVFQFAVEWQIVDSNPCIGIKRHKETPRDRYINDAEFAAIRAHAVAWLVPIIDMCYLTAQRINDVLTIRMGDISDDGIAFQQQKTGNKLLVRMTPDIEQTIEQAKATRAKSRVGSVYLFSARAGKAREYRTVRDKWEEACAAAGVSDAHLHDLRAKGLTDTERQGHNAQTLGGHTDRRTTQIYIRLRDTPTAEPPTMPSSRKSKTG